MIRPFLEQDDKGERREEEDGEPEEFSEHCHAGDFSLGGGGVNRAVLEISCGNGVGISWEGMGQTPHRQIEVMG